MLTSVFDSIRKAIPPIHREGYPFIAAAFVAALLLLLLWEPLGWIGFIITIYVAFFFRDPVRVVPADPNLVVSPADGIVTAVDLAAPPPELGLGREKRVRISVFLSIFNVHVNRVPVGGTVARIAYRPGKFLNADLDKASEDNERNGFVIESPRGVFGVVQIAGLIARRIVAFSKEGDSLAAGDRIGLIRFGSRVDVYMPPGCLPLVAVGSKAVAGETIIADFGLTAAVRQFRSR